MSFIPASVQPLSRRLPLMMAVLLSAVFALVLWVGHSRVHDSVVASELSRLGSVAHQLTSTLQASTRRLQRENVRIAGIPALGRAVSRFATTADLAAARRVLAAERAKAPQVRAIALWSPDGKLVLAEGAAAAAEGNPPRLLESQSTRSPEGADIGPLNSRGDTVTYGIFSPLKGSAGETIGFVAVTRRISGNPASSALLGGLVGKGAKLLLGNITGDSWTDFTAPVAGPPTPVIPGAAGDYADASGTRQLFATSLLPETPWMVLVNVPRKAAVATATGFVLDMLLIAMLVIIAGVLLAWLVIRRSLRPLETVTGAAEGLASGDYSRRVPLRGDDELGRLGASFNEMASKVEVAAAEVAARARLLEASNRELHESEQRYRDLIEHSPDGILVHQNNAILFANPVATRLLGASDSRQLVGRSVLDFVAGTDRDLVKSRVSQVQNGGPPLPIIELKLLRSDKKQATIEVTSRPHTVDGRPAIQTIMHDVTDQRLLQEQLRQSQKMDAVGRLAGGIAHDFNNLLTIIQAHAEFALSDDSETTRRSDIEEIRRASESAARLTRQLLTFSRKQVLSPSHTNLNDAIEGMLGMLARLIGENIKVVTIADQNLADIWADPGQLEQVLLNLAVNGRDAMPDGGILRFETANVSIGEGYDGAAGTVIPAGDYVMLAVQDSGVGMTEEVRTRVFEPFFTTKQAGRGTGLGLSTVYGIVRQADGHIWIYSEPGRGTTFKIFFPTHRREDDEPARPATAEHRIPALSAHILVVEDEPSVRSAICRALTHASFTVIEAPDAAAATKTLAADDTIDLVITDMVMPGKSGAELVEEIASSHPGVPVIVMSGYSEDSASRQWRLPENVSFLEKPVSPRELVKLVVRLLSGSD